MQTRRSEFMHKAFFSGATRERLLDFMEKFMQDPSASGSIVCGDQPTLVNSIEEPGILGVFTGQGAQWATMGRALVQASPSFRSTLERCEEVLASLPDGPSWSLINELLAEEGASRISEAALSQPLCTALQLALVELLRATGIPLHAVVGHSSGEIAAVYAAGIINLEAAIQIAYYRGLYARLASSPSGQPGQMMAVGISYSDALDFCAEPRFSGRVVVAASNSPGSVTLSGDKDVIGQLKDFFDTQKIFARTLRTDTAYHSFHMDPCGEPYLDALRRCNIQVHQPSGDCTWISSVFGNTDELEDFSTLKDQYWVDNMRNPVLFSQAIESSFYNGGPFDVALEFGPHPALKGPVEQTLKAATGSAPAYAGLMRRGDNEIEALSGALGFLWSRLGSRYIDWAGYSSAFQEPGAAPPQLLKELPGYAWDHSKPHWRESRISRRYRLQQDSHHELLGRRVPDDADDDLRWRNVFRLAEIPWVRGHVFQGQYLFPGAGYVVMALEAARKLVHPHPVRLIELSDVSLVRAIVIPDNAVGVETLFSVKVKETRHKDNVHQITAEFSCHFCPDEATAVLAKACSGSFIVHLGTPSRSILPSRAWQDTGLAPVDMDRFYGAMENVGLQYTGLFNGLKFGHRALGTANVQASWPKSELGPEYLIDPGLLDVAFQSLYVAFSSPASGDIWAPYLPVRIQKLAINPIAALTGADGEVGMNMDAFVDTASSTLLSGDINVYGMQSDAAFIQVEGIAMQAVSEPAAENDKALFSKTNWVRDIMSGLDFAQDSNLEDDDPLIDALDRVSLYYWQHLIREMSTVDASSLTWYHQLMLDAGKILIDAIRNGHHPIARPDWLSDTRVDMEFAFERYRERVDMRLIKAVGENLPSVLRGQTQLLEVMLENDLLNRFYMEGYGFDTVNNAIASAVKQITDKHPQASILEIGAGTGGTTRKIFDTVGSAFSAYTYTDISTGFFEKAGEKFHDHRGKMIFKALDIEKNTEEQGYAQHSYDVVIAANVLHATRRLCETMDNVRTLLKPGGYLILMEITGSEVLRTQFIMGGLPGWWYGADEGRVRSPAISILEWEQLLQETGFSGIDHTMHDMQSESRHSFSLMVSQATDDKVALVREPHSALAELVQPPAVVIVGGKTLQVSKIVAGLSRHLLPWKSAIWTFNTIDTIPIGSLPSASSIIFLEDMDQPVLSSAIPGTRLQALQDLIMSAKEFLWVTRDRSSNPQSNMGIGIGRALMTEIPDLRIQYLDLAARRSPADEARTVAEFFLRLMVTSGWSKDPEFNALWSFEPEVTVVEDAIMVPRVKPQTALNNAYNARRRLIQQEVSLRDTAVELKHSADGVKLELLPTERIQTPGSNMVVLLVDYSVPLVASSEEGIYLCLGKISECGKYAVAASPRNSSRIEVAMDELVVLDESTPATPALLASVANHVVAAAILNALPTSGKIVFHGVPQSMRELLRLLSSHHGFLFSASEADGNRILDIQLQPSMSARALKRHLPVGVGCLVNLASSFPQLESAVPSGCRVIGSADLPRLTGTNLQNSGLPMAYAAAKSGSWKSFESSLVRVQDLVEASSAVHDSSVVVDWTDPTPVYAALQPLSSSDPMSADRTYLLVGMTGGLGLSISQWLIKNGARHLALASRNANVSPVWLSEMEMQGATVKVFKADVANKASLANLLQRVKESMPPIAGVCNASMVLSDKLFVDMEPEDFEICLRPKVEGSRLLDEAFADADLDFFVLFSSLASIIGNAGQSNYHVANLFMSSLAAQRREKGLAASVVHIGLVTDVGYVARHGQAMEERLRRLFFMPLSETDIHCAFAEAVRAGKPDSNRDFELILGLEPFTKSDNATRRPPWEHNPRFSHFVLNEGRQDSGLTGATKGDVRAELQDAACEDDATLVVQGAFCRKLEAMMQLPPDSVNVNVPLIDLGCDSLLAIEIRNWFLKELSMDVPVLKVLSGDTVAQICADATKRFLAAQLESAVDQASSGGEKQHYEMPSKLPTPGAVPSEVPSTTDGSVNDSLSEDGSDAAATSGRSTELSWPQSMESSFTAPSSASSIRPSSPEAKPDVDQEQPEPLKMRDTCKASFPQSRLMFLDQYLDDRTTYNVAVAYDVPGSLHMTRFKRALTSVISHHTALQTCFFQDPHTGALMQGVLEQPTADIKVMEVEDENEVKAEFSRRKSQIWDLSRGKTFGVTVVKTRSDHHVIIFAYHHIVMDGVSWHTFLKDLDAAYRLQPLEPAAQYIEFSRFQQQTTSENAFKALEYWRSQFTTLPEVMPLLPVATKSVRHALTSYDSHVSECIIPQEIVAGIKRTSQVFKARPFHFHLTTLQTMLARLIGQMDVCLGIADANRTNATFARTVGFLLNMLPIRGRCAPDVTFGALLQATAKTVYDAAAHSETPLEMILDSLQVPRSRKHSPLFQVGVNYRAGDLHELPLGDTSLKIRCADDARNPYDISWTITERGDGTCAVEVYTQKSLYSSAATDFLLGLYAHLLQLLATEPEMVIGDCPVGKPDHIDDAIQLGRGPKVQYDWPSTLSERFEQMVEQYGDSVAVKDREGHLTYRELSALQHCIASEIENPGVDAGTPIAVLCQPSRYSVASMLAVLSTGHIYTPLDTRLPAARHQAMLESCGARLILCDENNWEAANNLSKSCLGDGKVVNVSEISVVEPSSSKLPIVDGDATAFLLFTSGSTG
jgi:aspyridone synthetase, hybrid polyketide synthase / nonribosomal peptide synthetase